MPKPTNSPFGNAAEATASNAVLPSQDIKTSTPPTREQTSPSPVKGSNSPKPRSKIQEKLEAAAPYNIFLTKVNKLLFLRFVLLCSG